MMYEISETDWNVSFPAMGFIFAFINGIFDSIKACFKKNEEKDIDVLEKEEPPKNSLEKLLKKKAANDEIEQTMIMKKK